MLHSTAAAAAPSAAGVRELLRTAEQLQYSGYPVEAAGLLCGISPHDLQQFTKTLESDRAAALIISKALKEPSRMKVILATEPAFKLDYAEIIDEKTFQVVSATTQNKRAIIAGWVNGVRLLDNAVMESNS